MAKKKEVVEVELEKQLWRAADKLRKNIDAAEYKHVVLGLIFLKYISVSFEVLYQQLKKEVDQGADPEDREEYKAENVFFVPVDARNMGHLINRRTRELSSEDIDLISDTYHNWRNVGGSYQDVAGFCACVSIDRVAELDYVLTPGRFVGLPDEQDDFNFGERFTSLKAEFEEQLKEEARLNELIKENLSKINL